jgi:hypothetical protein
VRAVVNRHVPECGGDRPGEIAVAKLVVSYATDPARVAALLPPGLEPLDPVVTVGFYCVPVLGEPELGVSVKVEAAWRGVAGQYTLGLGIDQEAAVHISGETNGQPKFRATSPTSATATRSRPEPATRLHLRRVRGHRDREAVPRGEFVESSGGPSTAGHRRPRGLRLPAPRRRRGHDSSSATSRTSR